MASSPSIREFSRVDDAAIFIDDTFDADTVRSIAGTSPSAVVMLSPQRMPVDRDGYSPSKQPASGTSSKGQVDSGHHPTTYVSGISDSARKRPFTASSSHSHVHGRLFGTELSNNTPGSASKPRNGGGSENTLRSFGSRLCFSACTTPKDPRKASSLTRPVLLGRRASSAGETLSGGAEGPSGGRSPSAGGTTSSGGITAESLADILKRYVPIEDFERLEKERNRYREMYRYQAQLCEELTTREAEAQAALQEKIIEIIALSSRNEESKRFIRQMKREMQECRERALPFLNRKLDEIRVEQSLKEKYDAMLRSQEAIFEAEKAEMEKEMGALEALLKDSRCAAGMGKNSDSLLRASYLKNTRMFNDLYHTRRERDAEMDRRIDLEKQIDALRKERRDMELTLSKERRAHCLREEQLIEDVHVMHEEVMALTNELLEVQLQRDAEAQAADDREAAEAEEAMAYVEGGMPEEDDDHDHNEHDKNPPPRRRDRKDDGVDVDDDEDHCEAEDDEEDFQPTIVEEEYNATARRLDSGESSEEEVIRRNNDLQQATHNGDNNTDNEQDSTRTPPIIPNSSRNPPRPGRRPLAIPH